MSRQTGYNVKCRKLNNGRSKDLCRFKSVRVLFLCPNIGKEEPMNIGVKRETQDFLVGEQLVEVTKVRPNDSRTPVSIEKFKAMLRVFKDRRKKD